MVNVPSTAVALKLVRSTTAPARVNVPATFKVRPAVAGYFVTLRRTKPLAPRLEMVTVT